MLRGRASGRRFAQAVREVALKHSEGLPIAISVLLQTFEILCDQIATLDEQSKALVANDAVCTQLQTIPGVGVQVSLAFVAHIDEPHRFGSSEELASYLALVPGESTTGGKLKRTGTIKAGPAYLKALLVQAAWSMWRARPNDPVVKWARRIGEKRGKWTGPAFVDT